MSRRDKKRESKDPADEKRRPDKPSYAKKTWRSRQNSRLSRRDAGQGTESLSEENCACFATMDPKGMESTWRRSVRLWFCLNVCLSGNFDVVRRDLPFRFLTESLSNLVAAFLWPLPLLEFSPPWGIAILAAIYLLFTYLIKEPLEKWLFHEEEQS